MCVSVCNATENKGHLRPQKFHIRSSANYTGNGVWQNKNIYSHHFKNTSCFNTLYTHWESGIILIYDLEQFSEEGIITLIYR